MICMCVFYLSLADMHVRLFLLHSFESLEDSYILVTLCLIVTPQAPKKKKSFLLNYIRTIFFELLKSSYSTLICYKIISEYFVT